MSSGATRLDIYNMALGFIGTRTVGSPNEQCPEAIQCNLMWDRARRSALRDFPYAFAKRRIKLAEKEVPDEYAMDWNFCYGTASDCLKVLRVFIDKNDLPFITAVIDNVTVIFADRKGAYCEYVADVENLDVWDELFVTAMARKLACLIAVPLLKNTNECKVLDQLYQQAIPSAEGHSASERRKIKEQIDSWALPHWGDEYGINY